METQNSEFDDMSQVDLENFRLDKTTQEVEDEAVRRRAEQLAERLREKNALQEEAFAEADKVIIGQAEMEARRQTAKQEGKEDEFKKYEAAKDQLPSLEGKIESLQREIQKAEAELEEAEKIFTQWSESGGTLKKFWNRIRGNTDLQKTIDLEKEKLAAKEYALDEANIAYQEMREIIDKF
ncbi:MAG: hypothetical protein ABH826_02615 [Patescibacteria group bacterium]|nr:hypothetical protein [Patescibacteria group bacterium]